MSEVAERITGIVANTTGNVINPAVTGLMTVAAAVTGDHTLAMLAIPVGAAAGALADDAVHNVRRLWAREGVNKFAEVVAEETEMAVDDFVATTVTDRRTQRFLGEAVAMAADAPDEWHVRLLARAFVAGAKDASRIDEMQLMIKMLTDFNAVDARALAAIAQVELERADIEQHLKAIGKNYDYYTMLAHVDHGFGAVAPLVCPKLLRLGLAAGDERWIGLSPAGRTIARILSELGSIDPAPGTPAA